jgi:predicted metalloprotease with PDZ domain
MPPPSPRLRRDKALVVVVALAVAGSVALRAQSATVYRLTFAEREQKIMQVEATFTDVPAGPLQLRMSRSSPGRYALHEFAKNVIDVRATDGGGRPLSITRPEPHQWDVDGHSGEVRVTYRISGDRVDGTYLAINTTHAHINMPAAIMWARGFDQRPIRIRFEPPAGASWRVATQLLPGRDSLTFTAPNLQYLMDSPAELSAFALRTFTVADEGRTPVFRVAVHHVGTDAEVDRYVRDVEAIVRETRYVFGEFPAFENNTYTFIADHLPGNRVDGMEHRNSTVMTSPRPLAAGRPDHLATAAHEFCHAWNVERIRPASLEPFNFEQANVSGELWLAEGFCNYYGTLVLRRSGFVTVSDYARELASALAAVIAVPRPRSAVEMSRLAPLVDGAAVVDDPRSLDGYISYYTWGDAVGLALDLTLRDRTDGRVTLDDYMRALWARFGRSAATRPGYVVSPYTLADVRKTLAEVAGDDAFAADFFERFIEGRDVADYARLLSRAGFLLRRRPNAPNTAAAPLEVVPAEQAGQPLSDAQRSFRDAWLSSRARNTF